MYFAQKLALLMEENGLSNLRLANEIGSSDRLVGAWRKGESIPSLSNAQKIAEFFGVSLDYLACRTEVREVAQQKEPALDLSEDELDLLACFRQLDYKEQQRLIGNAQYAAASAASAQEGTDAG